MSRFRTDREKEIQDGVNGVLKKYLNPKKIVLFGSRGKGRFSPHADFDLAVDAKKPDSKTERLMLEEIERIAGLYGVDIIYLDLIDEDFRSVILQTGKTIYEK